MHQSEGRGMPGLGSWLGDRYHLEDELGQGAMGIVYLAKDNVLERQVAVKVLSKTDPSSEQRSRLLVEARAVAKLNHPNIVAVYDAGEYDGVPYVVMEFVQGQTLREIERPHLEASIGLAADICSALDHAHRKGIIHRDLKPENVMITPERTAKLMDFGLARVSGGNRLTVEGTLLGTFTYLAPELIQGQAASPQSDLYALGVMLYELMTGRPPFQGDNAAALLTEHLYAPVVPASTYNQEIRPDLDALINHLLEKEPVSRPVSAAAVSEQLYQASEQGEAGVAAVEGAGSLPMSFQRPETQYVRSGDVHIAYQVIGEGPVDIVFVSGFVSHLEQIWEEPGLVYFNQQLATFSRLILFDKRGVGLSDRVGYAPTLEHTMDDILAVMNAVGSGQAVLFGVSEGGPNSALFAATYPERLLALILYGTLAKGTRSSEYPWILTPEQHDRWLDLLVDNWGTPVGLERFAPTRANEGVFRQWWAKMLRLSSSPGSMKAVLGVLRDIDVRQILPTIHVPTLILQRSSDSIMRAGNGRYLAEQITRAKYVELDGVDHWWWVGDPDAVLSEIEGFIKGLAPPKPPDRMLATVLAMEIAEAKGMPKLTSWSSSLLGRYEPLIRGIIAGFRGKVVSVDGDHILVMFDGPNRAVSCATAASVSAQEIGITIRAALHSGECVLDSGVVKGAAAEVATAAVKEALPGQVLVTNAVKNLAVGSGFAFEDRGEFVLDGVGSWHLFALRG